MAAAGPGTRRMNTDIMRLVQSKHDVTLITGQNKFIVKLHGPANTAYEGGVWKVRVVLPEQYPFQPPSIKFMNTMFHPNIDEESGMVCLDVVKQTWTPLYDLVNIFELFLPQLLTYPNPTDPLNCEAANLYLYKPDSFKKVVRDYIQKYATEAAVKEQEEKPLSSESSMSDDSDDDKDKE